MDDTMKITHVIAGLSLGGAQMMLYKLLSMLDRSNFQCEVISLADVGPLDKKIAALEVPVKVLGMRPGVPDAANLYKLARWWRRERPDVVQTWMYHADLIGGLAAKLAGGIPVAWNIRHTNQNAADEKRTTRWTIRSCARLSRWLPNRIVCCSEASQRIHSELGYAAHRMVVIPNGFDLAAFKPDAAARFAVRRELAIPDSSLIIGLVGRFNPQKDHGTFARAAGLLSRDLKSVYFLLCGDEITPANTELVEWLRASGIYDRCHLLGRREDIPRLTAAFDIGTIASAYGEGFPNVVGEAMACGVPCVVTDVGDAALIVQDTGKVVPPRDPAALAEAWRTLAALGTPARTALGVAARHRIEKHFSLPRIVACYQRLYEDLVLDRRSSRRKALSPESNPLVG
jgi:glycosyltransferase involved in cell wall biosynthesis